MRKAAIVMGFIVVTAIAALSISTCNTQSVQIKSLIRRTAQLELRLAVVESRNIAMTAMKAKLKIVLENMLEQTRVTYPLKRPALVDQINIIQASLVKHLEDFND